jgi:hypothetical protein
MVGPVSPGLPLVRGVVPGCLLPAQRAAVDRDFVAAAEDQGAGLRSYITDPNRGAG